LPNTEAQTWFFQADHHLSPEAPNDETGFDVYHVDFNATSGMNNRWHTGLAGPVIYPDRAKEDRRLLTYNSAPLEHDLEITGYPVVTLYVASTEEDGAFFVYLEDVDEGTNRTSSPGHAHVSIRPDGQTFFDCCRCKDTASQDCALTADTGQNDLDINGHPNPPP